MRFLSSIALAALLIGCTDPRSAMRAVDAMGMSDVEITGYRWLGCGDDYTFHTGFMAKNPKGKPVSGVVCSGYFKGSSVKFD